MLSRESVVEELAQLISARRVTRRERARQAGYEALVGAILGEAAVSDRTRPAAIRVAAVERPRMSVRGQAA